MNPSSVFTMQSSDLQFTFSQLRKNILFGSEFDPAKYWKTIDVSALQHDLDLLPVSKYTNIYPCNDLCLFQKVL